MTDTTTLVEQLVRRVELLEDTLAIQQLITTYGPAVDSGSAEAVGALWTEDGVYEVDSGAYRGRDAIMAMVRSEAHQGYIHGGCGHLLDPLNIRIDGDTAVVTCHSQLILNTDKGFRVKRVTANRWELVRADGRWQVKLRIARVLDGRADARDLLAAGVA
ncbi:nuclear transport factor 2 family protein [Rhodococcus sp. NPDC003382]|uniref:nuclear transport factor 2 family protein n=1 Tax=unclassified Rhodococcus (in: high G+C Gram-positive bacteria) TaxID=192944 RepID=UPI0018CDA7BB|nr:MULTISPECIES: nuclear transport factor 2 family protein [unclassified Rhodococcus (in: high G+C Gram-positive bacteria)]MBH0119813.1 nuclear transport factor 2 family protein [Rhodococcus sp. CX]MCK8672840.1 nuclear transport factor 2 family protein [Rhodococcus sp. HM1]